MFFGGLLAREDTLVSAIREEISQLQEDLSRLADERLRLADLMAEKSKRLFDLQTALDCPTLCRCADQQPTGCSDMDLRCVRCRGEIPVF